MFALLSIFFDRSYQLSQLAAPPQKQSKIAIIPKAGWILQAIIQIIIEIIKIKQPHIEYLVLENLKLAIYRPH